MKINPRTLDLTQIRALPCYHQATIPESYLDEMGHMNIQHYVGLFSDGAGGLLMAVGMDEAYVVEERKGAFALEQHISYVAEVHAGQSVSIHGRVLARDAKRLHFMLFMVNETTNKLAAIIETINAHADLTLRRVTPYPPTMAAKLDALLAEHEALPWEPPLCGAIGL